MGARLALVVLLLGCSATKRHTELPRTCKPDASVLYVPWREPHRGEQIEFRSKADYVFNTKDGRQTGDVRFSTVENVTSVDRGVIEELEVRFVEGHYAAPSATPRDITGHTFRFSHTDGKPTYFENDKPASPDDEPALRAYERNDVGRPHWLLRLLTDRTYKIGIETHLPSQSVRGSSDEEVVDARITLRSFDARTATFAINVKLTNTLPMLVRGDVVLDVQSARLASTTLRAELDATDEARKKGLGLTVDVQETWTYPQMRANAPATSCSDVPKVVLHVPWQSPTAGERFSFEQAVEMDIAVTPQGGTKARHVRAGWDVATDEKVISVADGVITSLQAHLVKAIIRPVTIDAEPPVVSHSGKTFEVSTEGGTLQFKLDGAVVDPRTEFAIASLSRGDVPLRYWPTRLVTDRTFERGVEAHFTHELITTISPKPGDVRITLTDVSGDIARFRVDIRVEIETPAVTVPMSLRGMLELDTSHARLLHLHLDGSYETPDRMGMSGSLSIEQRFRYPES